MQEAHSTPLVVLLQIELQNGMEQTGPRLVMELIWIGMAINQPLFMP